MRDLAAVLKGTPSRRISGRKRSYQKKTFRIGPEPEEDDSFADDE